MASRRKPHLLGGDEAAERRLTAEYVTARALVESHTLAEATSKILQGICEALGWERRALGSGCQGAGPPLCGMLALAQGLLPALRRRQPGGHSPRRRPAGTRVVSKRPVNSRHRQGRELPRAHVASREGLHAAFGFPSPTASC